MRNLFLIMALAITVFACQSETKTESEVVTDSTEVVSDSVCVDTACVDSCKKAKEVK